MKIVATADTHFPIHSPLPDGDLLIVAGDLMYQGTPSEWKERVEALAAQPHAHKIYVPGNHDYFPEQYSGVAVAEMRRAGVTVMGVRPARSVLQLGEIKIMGLPFVTGLPGWAFDRTEQQVMEYLDALVSEYGYPDIMITHAPMYGVLDAIRPEQALYKNQVHVGCQAYNRWFHRDTTRRPKYWFHGHIHESYGTEVIEGCEFYNVAMCDREYQQVNPPFVIEV